MANITTYIEQIQNAVYGEEVRGSIINALQKVNDDNESYQQLKQDVIAAKDKVETAVAEYEEAIETGNAAKSALEDATSDASVVKSALDGSISSAGTKKTELDGSISSAGTAKTNLEAVLDGVDDSVSDANTAKSALDSSINTAGTRKTALDDSINTADTSKTNLDASITNAGNAKEDLQDVIDDSNTKKTDLSAVVTNADNAKSELQNVVDDATSLKTDLTSQNSTAAQNIDALADANFDANEILTGVEDIKAYLGYTDEDIVGIQVDYENKSFQRLAGAYDLNAGEDFNKFEMFGGRKHCNVSDDGTIVAWYGDEDYTEDGTMGQVMVYQPAFYYKVVPLKYEPITDGVGYHLRKANYYVSTKPKTGFKRHPAFYDASGNEVDYIFLSAFEGCIYDVSASDGAGAYILDDNQIADFAKTTGDKFSSIAGAKPASGKTQQLTRPNVEVIAQNRGAGWHGDLIKPVSANQLLMIIEMGMMNSQTAIANGVVSVSDTPNTENNSIVTGGTSSLGNGTGQAEGGTNGKSSISYRGVENPWGNIWKFVYGVNIHGNGSQKGGIPYICSDFNFAESKNSDNYESAGFTVANANGYISAMGYSEEFDWLFFPSEATGNSSLPVGDYLYVTSNLNGYRVARLGGSWNGGGNAGAFCWHLGNGVGYRNRIIGARLVYIPTTTDDSYEANLNAWRDIMTA